MTSLKSTPDTPLPEAIHAYLERAGLAADGAVVLPLTGDASDRRYFRVIRRGAPSLVLALHAAPFEADALPFVNVAGLLAQVPVPIPAILDRAGDLGILAQQDLGDVTLQAHLGAASPTEHAALYRQAIGYIADLQQRGQALASDGYLPYRVAFDVEKLTWEMEFFIKHFCVAYRGAALDDAQRAALSAAFAPLIHELASEPRVLCHRDYHSRNLMWHAGRLFIIDFQDARLGPDTYDLASLLRDSYVDITDDQLDDHVAYFMALKGIPGAGDAAREFRRRFDVMSLQRNLKALGTFGYMTATRRNPVYIQYIPRTLRYARSNLFKYERFSRLRALLAPHVPEFA
ncbi:MAG: phosphotransferase [Vicinamibacterales bacterium]|nr:phosphotransferase [Vicinamibacterales bacterium]